MWNRKELKDRAKQVMKRSYWMMFSVSIVAALITGTFLSNNSKYSFIYRDRGDFSFQFKHYYNMISYQFWWILNIIFFAALFMIAIVLCYRIFVANPISLGETRFYVYTTERSTRFKTVFSAFSAHYGNVVKILFLRDIKVIAWSLLLVIPGIIKAYEYRMINYLLADDPTLSSKKAFALSKQMTNGQKGQIFVMDLSFIGWQILGLMAFGIGIHFVTPYVKGSFAELYLDLKDKLMEDAYSN